MKAAQHGHETGRRTGTQHGEETQHGRASHRRGTAASVRDRAEELRAEGSAFVEATVVRTEAPASARPGDRALILPDGTVEGFVGGTCAESTVRTQGLRLLDAAGGESTVLLRIRPEEPAEEPVHGPGGSPVEFGAVTVDNPCLSGGTVEVFLEAVVPPPVVLVHGQTPVACALAELGAGLGYEIRPAPAEPGAVCGAAAVVVASHGQGEEEVLTAALRAGVEYVGLVASPRRGRAVVEALDVCADHKSRVRTPAGLDIRARFPAEIALSILAEIVQDRPRAVAAAGFQERAVAVDPVCGMEVGIGPEALTWNDGQRTWYFCAPGCRTRFRANPGQYIDTELTDTELTDTELTDTEQSDTELTDTEQSDTE